MPPKRKRKRKQDDPHDELGVKVDRSRITKRSAADLLKHNPIKARALTKSRLMANMNKRQAQLDAEAIQAAETTEHKTRMTAAEKRNKIQLYADQAALNVRTLSASNDPRHRAIAAEAMQALQQIDVAKNIGLQAAKTAAARTEKALTPKPPPGPPPTSPAKVVQGTFYPGAKARPTPPKTPTAPKTPKDAPSKAAPSKAAPSKAAPTRAKISPSPKGKRLDMPIDDQRPESQVVVDARQDARAAQEAAAKKKVAAIKTKSKLTAHELALNELNELTESANENTYEDLLKAKEQIMTSYRTKLEAGQSVAKSLRSLTTVEEMLALHHENPNPQSIFERLNLVYHEAIHHGLDMAERLTMLGNAQAPVDFALAAEPLGNQPPAMKPLDPIGRKPAKQAVVPPPPLLPFAGDQP